MTYQKSNVRIEDQEVRRSFYAYPYDQQLLLKGTSLHLMNDQSGTYVLSTPLSLARNHKTLWKQRHNEIWANSAMPTLRLSRTDYS
jgi:hypothetical protein